MKRLTMYYGDCEEAYLSCERCEKAGVLECWTQEDCTQTVVNRLAEIEDIIGDDYDLDRLRVIVNQRISLRDEVAERFKLTSKIPIDRLRELIQADRDGRCVVLPCKVGDTVYLLNHHLGKIFENEVSNFLVGYESDNRNTINTVYVGKCGSKTFRKWKLQQVGKTVFLTREAAEAALKETED